MILHYSDPHGNPPKRLRLSAERSREKEGFTIAEVATRFDVGVASVTRWIKNIHRKAQGFRRRKIDPDVLRQDVLDYPDGLPARTSKAFGGYAKCDFSGSQEIGRNL